MRRKLPERAQASLEYLLTYGWALILVMTVVGVLIVITSTPEGYACSGFGSLICKAAGAESEDLVLTLQNRTGVDIIVNPFTGIAFDDRYGYGAIIYLGTEHRFDDVRIRGGDEFKVTGIGLGDASEISITYRDTLSGTDRTWEGGLTTPQREICNNGLDDDGDGLIDCRDTIDCETECTYVETRFAIPPVLTIAAGNTKTYEFDSTIPTTQRASFQSTSGEFSFYIEGTGTWDVIVSFGGVTYPPDPVSDPPWIVAAGQWYTRELTLTSPITLNNASSRSFTLTNKSGLDLTIKEPVATIRVEEKIAAPPGP